MEDFVHLHVHTQYSILDGLAPIKKLVAKAVDDGMRGMAVTDHGTMGGIKEFFDTVEKLRKDGKADAKALQEAPEGESDADREQRLKKLEKAQLRANFMPIIGCEMYVAHRGMRRKEGREDSRGWHLIVLAKNEKGYHNLVKLVSNAWVDGYYYMPRTEHSELEKYHEGLIVCSACLAGEVPQKILAGDVAGAEETVRWFKNLFGEDYYLELQRHEVKDPAQHANRETFVAQQRVNKVLLELAKKVGVKIVCTNDSHFVDADDAEAHERLVCVSTGKNVGESDRMLYSKQEWFKTRREMNDVFADVPEALSNTIEVLNKVEFYSINHAPIMPEFPIPEEFGTLEGYREHFSHEDLLQEFTSDEHGNAFLSHEDAEKKVETLGGYDKLYRFKLEADYLGKLTYDGAAKRYPELTDEIRERINFELHVMKTMGFPGYFLIVQDYINAARDQLGVSVGPGRGSAAGSVVAYCLGITQIDPLKYDLLFERFLNPDRISLPDIDTDFDDDGRPRVLQYVTEKYGAENCAHIITYGTMAAKSAIKDVARVEQVPLATSNRLANLVQNKLTDEHGNEVKPPSLKNHIAYVPDFKAAMAADPLVAETMKYATQLEGSIRNMGVHACGFIICRDKITDWVPVSTADDKVSHERLRCTQYEGKVIEETGLIKMDFLGLKNLSIIRNTVENIRQSLGIEINVDALDLEDDTTFQLFRDGNTVGVFQFESAGMQKYLRQLEPSALTDLIAMNALYRPGPMDYIPSFIRRKRGEEPITYDLPCMEKYLKDTYGVTVYQEQVMLLSREIAGFTRGESDNLRKAMGKKIMAKLEAMYPKFLAGGKKNGYDENILEKIWHDWLAFGRYAFNKSHSACYAYVAYQTGYLKANFPAQYMAGVMSQSFSDLTEITKLINDSSAMGVRTLGPDINESRVKFSVNHEGDIRFGLAAVKGVGEGAIENIVQERDANGEFRDIYDLVERIDLTRVNRKAIENLALAGAFDCFNIPREAFLAPDEKGNTFIDVLVRYATQYQADKASNANSLFGGFGAVEIAKPPVPTGFPPLSELEKLRHEKELLGIYLSGHPLDQYKVVVNHVCSHQATQLGQLADIGPANVTLGGIIIAADSKTSKSGKPYGSITLEDYSGTYQFPLFGQDFGRWMPFLTVGSAVYISGKIVERRGSDRDPYMFNVTGVQYLSDVADKLVHSLTISTRLDLLDADAAVELQNFVQDNPGSTELRLSVAAAGSSRKLLFNAPKHAVRLTSPFVDFLEQNPAFSFRIN